VISTTVHLTAGPTARTVTLPGHAQDLHIVALSEGGHRFQFAKVIAGSVYAYGRGVTLAVREHPGERYTATVVSVTGPVLVRLTYTLISA
jgi:hypothetical protein